MTKLPDPIYDVGDLVSAGRPDGTWISGRVFSRENGRNLGPRFGGPYCGWVYEIEPEGDSAGRVRVDEWRVEALEAPTV